MNLIEIEHKTSYFDEVQFLSALKLNEKFL